MSDDGQSGGGKPGPAKGAGERRRREDSSGARGGKGEQRDDSFGNRRDYRGRDDGTIGGHYRQPMSGGSRWEPKRAGGGGGRGGQTRDPDEVWREAMNDLRQGKNPAERGRGRPQRGPGVGVAGGRPAAVRRGGAGGQRDPEAIWKQAMDDIRRGVNPAEKGRRRPKSGGGGRGRGGGGGGGRGGGQSGRGR